MIRIDGSHGEGGGAIVRQALALSTLTGKAFEVVNIRKGRSQPGLKAQHLHSIKALVELTGAEVKGDVLGNEWLHFKPGKVKSKVIKVDVGTAGSITLLLQSLLLPCIFSGKKVHFEITGGTDVKWSQPIDYFANVLLPYLKPFADFDLKIMKRGYYPKGGGQISLMITGKKRLDECKAVNHTTRGKILHLKGVCHGSIELESANVVQRMSSSAELLLLKYGKVNIQQQYCKSLSVGTGITVWAILGDGYYEHFSILGADCLGEKGVQAEKVGEMAAHALIKEIESQAPVDHFLADQLVPLLGLLGGQMITSEITDHTKSNIYVTEQFLDVKFITEGNRIKVEK